MVNDRDKKGKRDTGQDTPGVGLVIRTQAAGAVAAPLPTDSKGESGAMAEM